MNSVRSTLYRRSRVLKRQLSSVQQRPRIEITYNYRHNLQDIPIVESGFDGELREIGLNEIELLKKIWPVPLDRMRKRLNRGDECYSMFINGEIAHYQWIQVSGWHYIQPAGRWMRIRDRELMVYHARVAGWARGRRINPFVKSILLQKFRESGYECAWVYTTASNTASQKGIERAGWIFAEGFRALNIGEWFIPLPGKLTEKPR